MGGMLRQEPQYQTHAMRRVPLGRMGQPEELIGAVLYLASDASSMVTGHVLAVDGGTLAVTRGHAPVWIQLAWGKGH
jgi:NAD(P)-dependent dehydrogenase (short-subunit alcohol dehydrogenase family)